MPLAPGDSPTDLQLTRIPLCDGCSGSRGATMYLLPDVALWACSACAADALEGQTLAHLSPKPSLPIPSS